MVKAGWPFWAAAPVGAVAAMLIGMAIALPALRLSGIYLAMATLAFAQFIQWAMLHWEGFTYGAGGFKVRQVDFAPLPLDPDHGIYYLSLLVTIVMVVLAANLVRSRLGRAFVAMRDGEIAAQALGIDLLRYKAMAFAISGFYAGVAGGLYCALLNFVSPESFDLFQMVLHKAMVVVGGLGSVLGSVLGATLVSAIEMLRQFKGTQEIVFGSLLLGFVLFQPNGLVSLLKRWVPGWDEPLHLRAAGERHTGEAPVPVRTPAEQEG
jgi:branched-chain amino acid transport system permease protein